MYSYEWRGLWYNEQDEARPSFATLLLQGKELG